MLECPCGHEAIGWACACRKEKKNGGGKSVLAPS